MAITKKTTKTSQTTQTKVDSQEEAKELRYVLLNPLFTPLTTTKEHYEELKRLNKIIETRHGDILYFRLDV